MFKNNFFSKNYFKSNLSFFKKATLSTIGIYAFSKYSFSKNTMMTEEEYKKYLLEGFENLEEGQMKEFKYAQGKNKSVLICKYEGKLRAIGNYCSHFGAPLHTGVMIDRVVKCPYHGASFDVVTGKQDIAPGVDGVSTFEIVEEGGKSYVKLPSDLSKLENTKTSEMTKRDFNNKNRIVVLGGGAAGLSACETLRQSGYSGEIVLVSNEDTIPYDRTMLTKWVPPTPNDILIRNKDFLDNYDITVKLNTKAVKVDNSNKTVQLSDNSSLNYSKLLVATGSSPVLPKINGVENTKNVHFIRTYNQAKEMIDNVPSKSNICILGGSFISMEAASLIKKTNKNANVTVLVRGKVPFQKELGEQVGNILKKLSEDNGVKFVTENEIKEVHSNNKGEISKIILNSNETINCDMLLLGTGVKANTELVSDLVQMDNDKIKSNLLLKTSDPSIFCAGDVASVPFIHTGKRYSYGHWVNAQQQGAISAMNMLDKNVPFEYVPYYWTRMWDKSLTYTGNGSDFDEVFIDGNISKYTFVAYYFKQGKVVGCASMGVSNATNIMYEAFRRNLVPRGNLIKDGSISLDNIKETVNKTKVKCSRATCACAV